MRNKQTSDSRQTNRPKQSNDQQKSSSFLYDKSDRQLTQFPIIKLHILKNIRQINLSNNLIANFDPIMTHLQTSQHALKNVVSIDISCNKINSSQALIPLADAALNLVQINIESNPFTANLNFLYDVAVMFKKCKKIKSEKEYQLDSSIRNTMIEQQLNGGAIIRSFLECIKSKTTFKSQPQSKAQELNFVQQKLIEFDNAGSTVYQKNQVIFQSMTSYIDKMATVQSNNFSAFQSPQLTAKQGSNKQIHILSNYQLSKSNQGLPNSLSRFKEYTTSKDLIKFYYDSMAEEKDIQVKLLEQVQVTAEQEDKLIDNTIDFNSSNLVICMAEKWKKQYEFTKKYNPESVRDTSRFKYKSKDTRFTSPNQTAMASRVTDTQSFFFSFDQEWTDKTLSFIKHRFQSLLRQLLAQQNQLIPHENKLIVQQNQLIAQQTHKVSLYDHNLSNYMPQCQSPVSRHKQYQTFGQGSQSLLDYYSPFSIKSANPRSPKTNNHYIASALNVLQDALKHIVFNKIFRATAIKHEWILCFQAVLQRINRRWQQTVIRRIYEESVLLECVQQKMRRYKLKRVIKAWKMIKKRREKLMKKIVVNKQRKQTAWLSVFMTQWRITARNISLQRRIKQKQHQLTLNTIQNDTDTFKLRRSATCTRLQTRMNLTSTNKTKRKKTQIAKVPATGSRKKSYF